MTAPWDDYPNCPCGIEGCVGFKLSVKTGHVIRDCKCRPCIGSRNQKKGRRAQQITHKRLGGESKFSPSNEEAGRPYVIEVTVMPEVKAGQQVPAAWHRFTETDWFRRALDQSTRAVPAGSGALPAVVLDAAFVIVDIRGKRGGA